jgi:hypothetical protein
MLKRDDLLSTLQRRGIRLWVDEGRLHFHAPKGALSGEDLDNLRAQRDELIESLEQDELLRGVPSPTQRRESLVPLTALQMRRWQHLVQSAAGRSERTCIVAQHLSGPLDVELVQTSLQCLVQRHEALRSRVVLANGVPHQQVDADRDCPWEIVRVPGTATSPAPLAQLVEHFVREKNDLCAGSAIAARLFRLGKREHVLVIAVDHMFADAVSCEIIARELWMVYRALAQHRPAPLPPLTLQFPDYALWQRRTCHAWRKSHEPYWLMRMPDVPPVVLPGATPSQREPPVSSTVAVELDGALPAWLREFARQERTLPALVVMTICVASLSRWLAQRDLLLAFVSNARDRPELQGMVGFLAGYLHLRIEVTATDSFVDLLRRIDREFRCAYEHQDYGRVPDLVPACLPELGFNWVPGMAEQPSAAISAGAADELAVSPFNLQLAFPLLPPRKLSIQFREADAAVIGALSYRPDVLSSDDVAQLAAGLQSLSREMASDPRGRVRP